MNGDLVLLAAASRVIPRDRWVAFLVTPATLLRWHRELVRRKWTYRRTGRPGRPPIDPAIRALSLGLARENARWGCVRIGGELRKVGIRVGATMIRTLLRTARAGPAPRRTGPTWTEFLRAQADGIIACDFCTVETAWLKDALQPRAHRAQAAGGSTAARQRRTPTRHGSPEQARNLALDLDARATTGCLVRDRDAKCSGSCDAVLRSVGMRVTGDRDDATPSASTGRSSRGGAILTGRSGPMASTTTAGDPIAPSAWLHRWQRPGSPCRSVRGIVAAGTCSAA